MALLTVLVTCQLIGPNNSSYTGATYTATLNTNEIWEGVAVPMVFTATVNDSGVAVLALWPNALSTNNSTYRIVATKSGTNEVFRDVTVKIPNNNCILDNLLVTPFSKSAPALSSVLIDTQSVLIDVNVSRIQASSSADRALSSASAALSSANIALGVADSVSRGPVASVNSKTGVVVLAKGDFGLGSVDNTADIDKIVSTAQSAANTTTLNSAKNYADSLVVGLWDDRGSFDASINTYPTVNGSGTSGAVLKGDIWTISIAAISGPLTGYSVGATVRAIVDYPMQTSANWSITSVGIGYVPENILNKDSNSGYAGLTLFKLNLRNTLNSITSWFTTSATTARTWTLPDKDGTVAMLADITGTNSGTNTGDQTNITGTASTITGVYAGSVTSSQVTTALTFTPYNATNPAGYGTGTLTNVTATGPVVSSGGTTPVISIPAATTTVAGYLTSADWNTFNSKQPSGTYATGTGTASGTNTGDENLSSIKTKLGITVLSGSNTGDQTNITGTAATITGVYAGSITSSQVTTALTFTPYNSTNPAGYGTGTLTAVTATGPVVSSGGTTPVISIPAATTTVSGYLTSADWTTFNGKQPSGTYATGTGTASGTNTGDQVNITGTAATITGVYGGTLTSSQITTGLTFTPYNSTNPAGYGTGTVTAVTGTGPVVSSGGTTPVISIPAATTSFAGYLTSADWNTFNSKQPSGTYATGTGTASGTNTGDETLASIKTKLGISVLSGSNTGDQVNITGTAATITGVYSGSITSNQVTTALTFTPYNDTNPAGYGTGTLTAVTATGPVVSSGGSTPVISIAAATTTVSGYLTTTDWNKFNNKQPAGSYITGTGTASGTNTGDQTTVSGNAGSATVLQTARSINGVAFNGSADITVNAIDTTARVASTLVGAVSGVASLDATGKVPATQLPSYVDDVLEYSGLTGFPATGETGKIYIAIDTNKTYRWSGSVYIYITSGAVDSVAGKTGVVTLVKDDVGLGSVDNTSDVAKPVSTAQQTAFNLKSNLSGAVFTGTVSATNLSGTNTGDQTNITGTAATITGVYSGSITSNQVTTALTFTPYNSTNPAGYTTSTGTGASGTWAINISGISATSITASNSTITTDNTTNGTRYIVFGVTGGTTQPLYNNTNLTFNPSTGLLSSTAFSGNITGDNNSYSDPKLKEDITKIEFPLDIIKKLNGVSFRWKQGFSHVLEKAGKYDIGILADEVQNVLPEIVTESNEINGETFKTVCYSKIIPVLIEAVKELNTDNESLKEQIKYMQKELLNVKDFIKNFDK